MSWDIHMRSQVGPETWFYAEDSWNYTWNVSPMYYRAFAELEDGFRSLDGMTGLESVEPLQRAIRRMEDDRAEYIALNPENGWGSYDGALKLLRDMLALAFDAPLAVWDIS